MKSTQIVGVDLLPALNSLLGLETREELLTWMQNDLQKIFPHTAFAGGIGRMEKNGIVPLDLLSYNFPEPYLKFICSSNGIYRSQTIKLWMQTCEPQLFDPTMDCPDVDKGWLEHFKNSGLRNIASHGVMGLARGEYGSYFSFHGVPPPLGEHHKLLLKLIVPNLHVALVRIFTQTTSQPVQDIASSRLTKREIEVLSWVSKGKTNDEISKILGVSYKTVKNQVQQILSKMCVKNRAEAVAKAIEQGFFFEIDPG